MDARDAAAGHRRGHRGDVRLVVLAIALYTAAAVWATWPAIRHADAEHYLARPAAGHGEAAAGDHLQLGWAFWLVGHQLERSHSPLDDPYTFQPVSSAGPNVQGWLLGVPFWPLARVAGPVWAYNLILLATFVLAGGLAAWWQRALGLVPGAALVGGLVFALMPYRVGQSTGHLLGLVAFLLPATLLALERRRFVLAALALSAIPLSGQLHLALGAIPLVLGYAWARLPRRTWPAVAGAVLAALASGWVVQRAVVDDSLAAGGRSFAQVARYSAEPSDFVTRAVGAGIEELVFLGWLTPLLALAGLVVAARRRSRGDGAAALGPRLALVLGAAVVVPVTLALGAHVPVYETLWDTLPGLGSTRVPTRLMPIACLAVAALVAFAVDAAVRALLTGRSPLVRARYKRGALAIGAPAVLALALAVDLRVSVFGAVAADLPSPAYAAIAGDGALLELPVFRPDLHYGSAFMAYARQSPRRRPQGYSTTAPPAADRWAREHRGLSCGRGAVPQPVSWVVVHRGLYAQSGFFGPDCPRRAEAALRAAGWDRIAQDGPISTWARTPTR